MADKHARRAAAHPSDTGRTSRSSFTQFARNRPLLVVGAAVALGMALGALLPWSRIGDELLDDKAAKLKDGALEMARDGYEKAKSVARSGYEAATEIVHGSERTTDSGESESIGHLGQGDTRIAANQL